MLLIGMLVVASSAPAVLDGGVRVRSHIVQHQHETVHSPQLQSRLGVLWGKNKIFGGRIILQDARRLSEMTSSQAGDLMLHQDLLAHRKYSSFDLKLGLSVFLPGAVARVSDLGKDPIIGGYIQMESRFK